VVVGSTTEQLQNSKHQGHMFGSSGISDVPPVITGSVKNLLNACEVRVSEVRDISAPKIANSAQSRRDYGVSLKIPLGMVPWSGLFANIRGLDSGNGNPNKMLGCQSKTANHRVSST